MQKYAKQLLLVVKREHIMLLDKRAMQTRVPQRRLSSCG